MTFEKPQDQVGKSRRAGPMTLTLTEYEKDGSPFAEEGSWKYVLELSYDPDKATAEWKKDLQEVPLKNRLLNQATYSLLKFGKTRVSKSGYVRALKGKGPSKALFTGRVGGQFAEPVSISFRLARTVHSLRIPVRFSEIPLPEAHR